MTDKERYEALLNIQVALGIARGYVGADAALSRPLSPEQMADVLDRASRDAGALVAEAVTGADRPRPQGTAITSDVLGGEPLLALETGGTPPGSDAPG